MVFMAQATLNVEGTKEHVQELIEQLWAAGIFVKRDSVNHITVAGTKKEVAGAQSAVNAFHDGQDMIVVASRAKGDQPIDEEFEQEESSSS